MKTIATIPNAFHAGTINVYATKAVIEGDCSTVSIGKYAEGFSFLHSMTVDQAQELLQALKDAIKELE